jgi:peptidoglycan/LPS O-acetylase OafA/YrhL
MTPTILNSEALMKSASVRPATDRLDALTTVRFFGAIYVVIGHWLSNGAPILTPHHAILWRLFHFGGSAVSGFFLLSGFILAWVNLRKPGPLDKRRFYVARFARIYPIFLAALLLDTPHFLFSQVGQYGVPGALMKTSVSFAGCLLMLQAWAERLWGPDFPNWSLSVETFCYVLFPFLGYLVWKIRGAWILISMTALYVGGQAIIAVAAAGAVAHSLNYKLIYFWPPFHLSVFLLGVLLAKLLTTWETVAQKRSRVFWSVYLPLGLCIAVYVGLIVVTPTALADSPVGSALIRDGILSPVFCLLLWALASGESVVSKLLSARWLVLLGEASYALYLIHVPVFHLVFPVLLHSLRNLPWREFRLLYGLGFLFYFALCIGLSVASFLWLETPSRRWLNKKLGQPRQEVTELLPGVAVGHRLGGD